MQPALGNLSWISHAALARLAGCSRQAVSYHLQAAEIIGELKIRFADPATAHKQMMERYDYTKFTDGKSFIQLLSQQPARLHRLNFYTVNGCHTLLQKQAYPDWMIDVIRLCAHQKGAELKQAHALANQHRLPASPKHKRTRSWRTILGAEGLARLRPVNCKAGHTVQPAPPTPVETVRESVVNCKAGHTVHPAPRTPSKQFP
jgi:hypothetical protein